MIIQAYQLDVIPGGVPVVIHAHQNDIKARAFALNLFSRNGSLEVPSGASAYIEGIKPDGKVFGYAATLDEAIVTVDLEEQMTVLPGDVLCQCKVVSGASVLIAANFILRVEQDHTVEADTSETEIPGLVQQAQAAAAAAEDAAANIDSTWYVDGATNTSVSAYNTDSKLTAGAINELKGRADTNAAGIAANKSDIATNKANIATNTSNISTLSRRAFQQKDTLPSGTDINKVTDIGGYFLSAVNTYTNLPSGALPGYLEVYTSGGNNISLIIQRFTEAYRCFFRRTGNGGTTWTDWVEIATDQNAFTTAQFTPTDMDDTSLFGVSTLLNAANVSNLPTASGYYRAICFPYYQLAARYYSSTGSPLLYQRIYANGQWYPWSAVNDTTVITETLTHQGVTYTFYKNGRTVVYRASGTLDADLASASAYVTLGTLPDAFKPNATYYNSQSINQARMGMFNVQTSGAVRIGYTYFFNGTGGVTMANCASGTSIYFTGSYITAS